MHFIFKIVFAKIPCFAFCCLFPHNFTIFPVKCRRLFGSIPSSYSWSSWWCSSFSTLFSSLKRKESPSIKSSGNWEARNTSSPLIRAQAATSSWRTSRASAHSSLQFDQFKVRPFSFFFNFFNVVLMYNLVVYFIKGVRYRGWGGEWVFCILFIVCCVTSPSKLNMYI